MDALERLNRGTIPYMLTGSMASNYWGIPRTTHDLDFVIQLVPSAIPLLVERFRNDFYLDEASVSAALVPPYQFNAIDLRSNLKIDFWTLRPDPFEQQMFARRLRIDIFGESAWIATKEDVILHKLYWNQITPSDRQLSDAAGIVALQKAQLDLPYLEQWARRLGAGEMLKKLLDGTIRPKVT